MPVGEEVPDAEAAGAVCGRHRRADAGRLAVPPVIAPSYSYAQPAQGEDLRDAPEVEPLPLRRLDRWRAQLLTPLPRPALTAAAGEQQVGQRLAPLTPPAPRPLPPFLICLHLLVGLWLRRLIGVVLILILLRGKLYQWEGELGNDGAPLR